MADHHDDRAKERERVLIKAIDSAGWGVFFIWVGVAILAAVGWGVAFLGISVITLLAQAARMYFALKLDRFALALGICFLLVGVMHLPGFHSESFTAGLMPLLCIGVGVSCLASVIMNWPKKQSG